MTDINELNIPDPKKDELIRQRQARIAAIAAMPDDDPVEADKMIPDENKESIINSLRRIKKLLEDGKISKWDYTKSFLRMNRPN